MKRDHVQRHTPTLASLATTGDVPAENPAVTLEAVYGEHAEFVWASLQRLGVADSNLADVFQEVFVVVLRRLPSFEGRSSMTTWLFGICTRVAAAHRRKAHVRREQLVEELPEPNLHEGSNPEADASRAEDERELRTLLDTLDPEKRAIFVMFEIDEIPCDEIARTTGIPVGTVHSRLFTARKQLAAAVARRDARRKREGRP